ncbi:MAG: NAD(P)H-dependent oxidoreductase [Clostridia bacterium]|nr:NAD(P)H-dependent oxidoreductase [Clostridia bacterium]
MKIVVINGGNIDLENPLNRGVRYIYNYFENANVDVESVFLTNYNIPYYEGSENEIIEEIMNKISTADGFIIATPECFYGVSGVLKVFMEYLNINKYSKVFMDKYAFAVVISNSHNEEYIAENILNVFKEFGSIPIGKISALTAQIENIENDILFKTILDSRLELFNKLFEEKSKVIKENKVEEGHFTVFSSERLNNDNITELTQFFTKQLESVEKEREEEKEIEATKVFEEVYENKLESKTVDKIVSGNKIDMNSKIQLYIEGVNGFKGYINTEGDNEYRRGLIEDFDLMITSNESDWNKIIENETTLQRAFMTGLIKIKGNFMLVASLDKLFS